MTRTDYWPAPAKINLFLHVTGRREDGYHELQTVFQFLDLHDRLEYSLREDGEVTRQGNYTGVRPQDDLVVRAAHALQTRCGTTLGADISVDKVLPMGGGLGGGSSDAATTLHALNRLWEAGLPTGELAALGLSLGADIPVFVHGEAAWAGGVGELLQPVQPPEQPCVVLWPRCSVDTARVFADPDLTRNTPAITIRDFLAGAGHNDCEAVVREAYPEIDRALKWLNRRAAARLTGTGGCIFAVCASTEQAAEILAEIPSNWTGFTAQGRNRSPLLDRLSR